MKNLLTQLIEGNPDRPKIITLILSTIIWLLGCIGYFFHLLPIPMVITFFLASFLFLLIGSVSKHL